MLTDFFVFSGMREIKISFYQRKVFLIFLNCLVFSFLTGSLFAQTISGKVLDERSGEPLPFSNVFISNTTLGATTDINGNYSITGQLPQNFELAVSFMGYYTKFRSIAVNGRSNITVNFELEPKVNQLEEVQLKAKRDKKWERDLKRFEKVFLALPDDPFLKNSRIMNPWVLDFEEGRENGIKYFAAKAEGPVQIENNALGYDIEYHLERFFETRKGFQYYGLVNFKEQVNTEDQKIKRNAAFQGSLRHLIQQLVENKLDYDLFEVMPERIMEPRTNDFYYEIGNSIQPITRDSLYICELVEGYNVIVLPKKLEVHFKRKPWPNDYYQDVYHTISWLEAPLGYFIVDKYGVLPDPTQLVRSGYMGRERMARFLPHDFEPDEELGKLLVDFDSAIIQNTKWNNLREKPHLTLNKSFYYPGEAIWFNATMLYQNPIYSDTLSRLLHVELYDKNFKVIVSEKFPIEKGKAKGVLVLPDQLTPENYVLRAYTQWMRNYEDDGFTYLPIPVIRKNQLAHLAQNEGGERDEESIEVVLTPRFESSSWSKKVELELEILEADLDFVGGEFSVSVLDADLNPDAGFHQNIGRTMNWLYGPEKSIRFDAPRFQIEYGNSISGYFKDRPKKPLNVPITIVQGQLEDYGVVRSDTSGYFWVTGLNFRDTLDIAIAALNDKRKRFGQVILSSIQSPEVETFLPRVRYNLVNAPSGELEYAYADLMSGDYFELEEVTVSNTALPNWEESNYGYGKGDRSIGSAFLEARPDLSLDQVIAMNMPPGGFGRYNFGLDAGAPVLIIDGARFFGDEAEVWSYLKSIIAAEVESIEIFTFSANIFGIQGFGGAIVVKTKKGSRQLNRDVVFDAGQFQLFKVKGYSHVPNFPVLKNNEGVIPRRSAIFWNPRIEWSSEMKKHKLDFNLSHLTSRIWVRVEGMSWDGVPFQREFEVEVPK